MWGALLAASITAWLHQLTATEHPPPQRSVAGHPRGQSHDRHSAPPPSMLMDVTVSAPSPRARSTPSARSAVDPGLGAKFCPRCWNRFEGASCGWASGSADGVPGRVNHGVSRSRRTVIRPSFVTIDPSPVGSIAIPSWGLLGCWRLLVHLLGAR
jgi:hypothetical protein